MRELTRRHQPAAQHHRDLGLWTTSRADFVRAAAVEGGARVALTTRTGQVTYAELEHLVRGATGGLVDAGLHPGDPLLLVMSNSVASVVAFHAAARVGAVVVAVSGAAGRADLTQAIDRTGPRFGIAPDERVERLRIEIPSLEWMALPSGDTKSERTVDPDGPELVLFTSGTTAQPKGVVHSFNTLHAAARNFIDAAQLTADDRFFLVSPLASITGVLQALYMAPMLQAAVVLEDHFDDDASLDLLLRSGATFYGGPDVVLSRLFVAARRKGITRLPLEAVALGGTMLDPALLAEAEDAFDIRVTRAYGSSEAPFSCATPRGADARIRLASDGRPLAGVQVKVGTVHDPGELAVRGPHLQLGYLDRSDDEAALDDGWFCTGDVAEIAQDGSIRIVGRIKDVVIRNGLKVSLAEVEQAAGRVDGVQGCVAYRVADAHTGEHVGIAVVSDRDLELGALTAAMLADGLATSKLPEELVLWTGPFPHTPTGKVLRDQVAGSCSERPRQVVTRLAGPESASSPVSAT